MEGDARCRMQIHTSPLRKDLAKGSGYPKRLPRDGSLRGFPLGVRYRNFLASIFANVTTFPFGRDFLMGDSTDKHCNAPITKLMVFTDHPNLVRRSGVLSTIKNCAFETSKHHLLLDEDGMNILPYLLLPLCGSEEFSDEDMDGMPDDIQLLPPDKQREPSEHLRKILVEILVLLTGTREGREYLRLRKVYPVVRTLHLWEKDEDVQEAIECLVQMLMGDEAEDTIS
ncbi:Protein hgh1 [Dispira parvispora]|uniref:Protein hgh1 n=1 Tax=Dispira parvispora TaxID=1520584 RepID=A0A9W8AXJ5_9FUNG|nr:Protein hgh1 [Dispira parvispora]